MRAATRQGPWRPDPVDRRIIAATQSGLPLEREPYRAVAERLGLPVEVVMARLRTMMETGAIRRIAAVPNHYRLGYRANGMAVWDVDDARVDELGTRIAALPFVSHCYRRPRRPPEWPYNLFTMLHGRERAEVEARAAQLRAILGDALRAHEILYSRRILKKTGLRLRER